MPFKEFLASASPSKHREKKREEKHKQRKESISAPIPQDNDRAYAIGIKDPRAPPVPPSSAGPSRGSAPQPGYPVDQYGRPMTRLPTMVQPSGSQDHTMTPEEHLEHHALKKRIKEAADRTRLQFARQDEESDRRAAQRERDEDIRRRAAAHEAQEVLKRQRDLEAARAVAEARRRQAAATSQNSQRTGGPRSPPLVIPAGYQGEDRFLGFRPSPSGTHYITPVDPPSHRQWEQPSRTSAQVSPISVTAPGWSGVTPSPVSPLSQVGYAYPATRPMEQVLPARPVFLGQGQQPARHPQDEYEYEDGRH